MRAAWSRWSAGSGVALRPGRSRWAGGSGIALRTARPCWAGGSGIALRTAWSGRPGHAGWAGAAIVTIAPREREGSQKQRCHEKERARPRLLPRHHLSLLQEMSTNSERRNGAPRLPAETTLARPITSRLCRIFLRPARSGFVPYIGNQFHLALRHESTVPIACQDASSHKREVGFRVSPRWRFHQ